MQEIIISLPNWANFTGETNNNALSKQKEEKKRMQSRNSKKGKREKARDLNSMFVQSKLKLRMTEWIAHTCGLMVKLTYACVISKVDLRVGYQ